MDDDATHAVAVRQLRTRVALGFSVLLLLRGVGAVGDLANLDVHHAGFAHARGEVLCEKIVLTMDNVRRL